jgi:hypothetical protein
MLMMMYLWTRLRVSFNAYMLILIAIQLIYRALTRNDRMILYYRLMTKVD